MEVFLWFISLILYCILEIIFFSIVDYILFRIFHFINKKVALFFFAMAATPWCGKNSKKIAKYCKKYCPSKNCKNCIYWTCDNFKKESE